MKLEPVRPPPGGRLARSTPAVLAVAAATGLIIIFAGFFAVKGRAGPVESSQALLSAALFLLAGTLLVLLGHGIRQRERTARERTGQLSQIIQLDRLNRLYSAFIHINRGARETLTRNALFERVCTVLVEHGGLRLAWIAGPDPRHQALMPVAQCGDTDGFLAVVNTDTHTPLPGREPSSAALDERWSYVSNDLLNDALPELPWRAAGAGRGFGAAAASPSA